MIARLRASLTVVWLAALLPAVFVASSARAAVGPPVPPVAPPKAAVVVDAGTGAVLTAVNDRTPVPVASAIKIFTALVVHQLVKPTDRVPISRRAAGMPARKLNLKAGQRWTGDALLHAMLLASANDAAVAMAEQAGGGTTSGYERLFRAEVRALRLQDRPTMRDPAGLDDEFSVDGGNLMSARDLAIVARAFLARPDLAQIVREPEYRFAGGDGHQHRVANHNRFLGMYPGAIGVKTGHTKRSGYTLVAAARRAGHTLIAVVVDSGTTIEQASRMLDRGFAAVRGRARALAYLPGPERAARPGSGPVRVARRSTRRSDGRAPGKVPAGRPEGHGGSPTAPVVAGMVLVGLVGMVVLRRQEVLRRQRARARARATRGGSARRPVGAYASRPVHRR